MRETDGWPEMAAILTLFRGFRANLTEDWSGVRNRRAVPTARNGANRAANVQKGALERSEPLASAGKIEAAVLHVTEDRHNIVDVLLMNLADVILDELARG